MKFACCAGRPQHFLYLRCEPHQHGALRGGGQVLSVIQDEDVWVGLRHSR